MKNPWVKKNPAMSIFLSAANAWAGAFTGSAKAAARRNTSVALKPARKRPARRRAL
jgi:hypothetical protein